MARKTILETTYTFTPGTNTIVVPRVIPKERLILITNVTSNTVIYNFSDPTLKSTSYQTSGTVNANSTTIVLNYNTAAMSSTDKLQIVVDDYDERFTPSEIYVDPVNKFRTSSPQALIDTDFEYGTQITKWENLSLINNRPFAFSSASPISNISSITLSANSRTVTVNLSSGTAPPNGTPITVQDTYLNFANGNFIILTGGGGSSFTYLARATNTTPLTNIFDSNKTAIYQGTLYSSSQIGGVPSYTYGTNIVQVTTTVPHGLAIGNEIAIVGSTATTNPPNGVWPVISIVNNTSFQITVPSTPTGTISGGAIYAVPQGQVLHRPFDGGVIFTSNANANFETTIRQTRRYFRYQSGKGIQVSSGTILAPNLQVDSISSSGTTVTVITKEQHNIQPGTTISVSGCNETAFNGTFIVTSIIGYNTFQYTALSTPSATPASGNPYVTVRNWYGAVNRLGVFDDQNGLFFEYNGQQLYAVRRSSTFQLSGRVSVTQGSNTVSQTTSFFPTYFSKQLAIGDYISIRGQSYRVIDIASDTSMTISPSYRGSSVNYATTSRVVDTKIPQSEWNLDKCDGTGPSGYNIDIGRMQMFYIDYSWYGAGFARWGFRGPTGDVIYAHKLANNNVNTEAYMRSGNLPARYESQALPPATQCITSISNVATTISVASTQGFPPSGTLVLRDATTYEYINYDSLGAGTNTFTGIRRAASGSSQTLSLTSGSNTISGVTTTNIQVGMRLYTLSNPSPISDGTFVSIVGAGTVTLSQASTATGSYFVSFQPMGSSSGQNFSGSSTNPIAVELAYPTFAPTISHWGTSVIMDGRFDDDKSLVFTYGQATSSNVPPSSSRALFSIRVAPSVDNGQVGIFGARDLVNRMQLTLKALDLTTQTTGANLLVQAFLNATPSTATNWTNAVGNVAGRVNSSLAQIADYAAGPGTTVNGGEVTTGFFVGTGANSIDLSQVRDLGNSILGGGGSAANTQIYPDGPDTLTIVVTNLSTTTSAVVFGRLSWTEAQA